MARLVALYVLERRKEEAEMREVGCRSPQPKEKVKA
jgi:hypothetical protein